MKIEGYPVYIYEEVTSTMDIAKNLVKENREGIVVAKRQTEGRGRYGRKWLSPFGGLYFSMVLKKKYITDYLNEVVSLSLIELMKSFGIENCKIKFPNDIIIERKKICGILIEKSDDFYILGIGINVKKNKEIEEAGYVSMEGLLNRKIEIEEVLRNFVKIFVYICKKFERNIEELLRIWSENIIK
ncbi:MAG: biotin--[acetyl-CoA-carboxylase] ligase [bacterium]|nr:biotin--[acetyl-CoA-carboxylase] ligase [bacterium]